jgi:hypothetical protein
MRYGHVQFAGASVPDHRAPPSSGGAHHRHRSSSSQVSLSAPRHYGSDMARKPMARSSLPNLSQRAANQHSYKHSGLSETQSLRHTSLDSAPLRSSMLTSIYPPPKEKKKGWLAALKGNKKPKFPEAWILGSTGPMSYNLEPLLNGQRVCTPLDRLSMFLTKACDDDAFVIDVFSMYIR